MTSASPLYGGVKWVPPIFDPASGSPKSGVPPKLTKREQRAKDRWYAAREEK